MGFINKSENKYNSRRNEEAAELDMLERSL